MVIRIYNRIANLGLSGYYHFQKIRRPFILPVCYLLVKLHINQSHVTLSRLFLLAVFVWLWIEARFAAALVILGVYFIADWIDGDLSRVLKNNSDLGKFEDLFVDNLMVVIFPILLIWQDLVPPVVGAVYIFLVTQSWWLAVIRRSTTQKSDWLFKPMAGPLLHVLRFWVITILMAAYAIWHLDCFTPALITISILLFLIISYDYFQIIKNRLLNRS